MVFVHRIVVFTAVVLSMAGMIGLAYAASGM